ncbi:MAG TPA: hypothetical protein VFU46_11525 [Gemmatimonadales bacterium]|nr:hypothetical protein [Gemmatimonadales bacterium]
MALDSTRYFSMAPGGKSPNLTEARPAITLGQAYNGVAFSVGAEGRIHPNRTGFTKDANTVSFRTSLGLPKAPFAPTLLFAYDVGGITGPYVEARLRQGLPVAKGVGFFIGGRAGYAIEQTGDSMVAGLAPYTRDGFTHVEVQIGASIAVAGTRFEPYLGYAHVPEPYVLAGAPAFQREDKLWVGASLTVAGRFPKPKR